MRKILAISTLFILFSCKEKLVEPPKDLIPEKEMTEILYDLAVLNGMRTTNPTNLKNYGIETMPYIYEKYKIDSLRFVTSDRYFASEPVIYQRMYQTIVNRLEKRIKELDKAKEKKNDSIKARNEKIRDSLSKQNMSTTKPVPIKK